MFLAVRFPRRLSVVLFLLNVAGIVWIHHDLTADRSGRLRVLTALPVRDVDKADRLSLVFEEPVVPASAVGSAVLESPFAVVPPVAGRWTWSAPDKLEYQLDAPLPPGRRFVVKASPSLERLTGRRLTGPGEFRFETRPLALQSLDAAVADRTHVHLRLQFDQPVNPADLLKHLEVAAADGSAVRDVTCLNAGPGERLTVRVARPAADSLRIRISGRLAGHGAELPLGEDIEEIRELHPRFVLLRPEVEPPRVSAPAVVRLEFSRELRRDQGRAVTMAPPVGGLQTRVGESDLILEGSFQSGVTYTATVSGNLLAQDGEALGEDATATFSVPEYSPALAFRTCDGILSPQGNLMLDLTAVNVGGVHLRSARVHANNLVAHLRGEERTATSRELPAKTIPLDLARNTPTALAVDLRGLLSEPLGVYRIEADAVDETWTRDSIIVAVTDLGITTKQERDGLLVWVTSLSRARPRAGVQVSAVSYNNQVLCAGVTDERGLVRLRVPTGHPDGGVYAVLAEDGGDVSFARPEMGRWSLDGIDVSGRQIPTTYDVMLYSERGVYRPGETIHLTGIVRDAEGQTPPAFPLVVTVRRPDGREVGQLPVTTGQNQQGVFQVDYVIRDDGHLGPYAFSVSLPGAAQVLGSTSALVEEFLPSRIELRAEPAQEQFGPGEPVTFRVAGRYLFDQPAADLPLTVSGAYRREAFRSKRFPDFTFDEPRATRSIRDLKTKLDAAGKAVVVAPEPPDLSAGWWVAELTTTVHEEGGRSVSTVVRCRKDTAGRFVGLRLPGGRLVRVACPVDVEWVQRTSGDEPAEFGPMSYALARVTEEVSLERVDGRYVWKSEERLTPVGQGEIAAAPTDGEIGRLSLTCPVLGRYRLELVDCGTGRATRVEFDAVAADQNLREFATGRPERLEITLDQPSYIPGATARALIKSPFAGMMLVTLESDTVLSERVVEVPDRSVELELPVDPRLRGGGFVTATLVREIDPQQETWLPHRAMGVARLVTDHSAQRMPVSLSAAERAEPGDTLSITVEAARPSDPSRPALVHVWAVDEGILMTTGFTAPDPHGFFLAPRKLGVTSSDLFDELMPDYQRPANLARIGGDGAGEEEALRRSPVAAPRREPALIWQGVRPLDGEGRLTLEVRLPRMDGELRLIAVVVDGDRYGCAERRVTVASPLLVEMSWPRFAAPGDEFSVPVKLFNTTPTPLAVELDLRAEGPMRAARPEPAGAVTVRPGEPVVMWWRARALDPGPVTLTAVAKAEEGGRRLRGQAESGLFVRPAGPLHSESRFLRVKAGEPVRIEPLDVFAPGTAKTSVTVSADPSVNLLPAVEQLIDYPYGCVEQTTSQIYALLYAPDLVRASGGGERRAAAIDGMIRAGIDRLWSMQTRSGGLSYWPGSREPDVWGTAYAAGLLVQAERKGHPLDGQFKASLGAYLEEELRGQFIDAPDADLRADLCYVLALMGKPQHGWMSRLTEQADELDLDGRAHLAGAWLEAGRKDRAGALLIDDSLMAPVATTTSGRLSSQVRAEAMLLNVLLDLDRRHPWIAALVARLEKARTAGVWGSTLENASAIAALARYQLAQGRRAVFQGVVCCGSAGPWPFSSGVAEVFAFPQEGRPIEVESTGQGEVCVSVTTRGLLRDGQAREYDRGMQVGRRWMDRQGEPVDPARVRVGDLVLVETSVTAPSLGEGETIDNVAVVDALPGGMEVENPRLLTSAASAQKTGEADRVEFRDDRVVIFTSVGRARRTFRYAIRAITAGTFALPPIEASCMYDAGVASVHDSGRVEIAR